MSDNSNTNATKPKAPKRGRANYWGRGGFNGNGKKHYTASPNSSSPRNFRPSADILNNGGKYIRLENGIPTTDSFQPHWRHYISLAKYEASEFFHVKLQAASEYLKARTEAIETTDELFNFKRFFVDFNDLIINDFLKKKWSTIEKDLDGNPDMVIGTFGLARYDLWAKEVKIRGTLPVIRYVIIDVYVKFVELVFKLLQRYTLPSPPKTILNLSNFLGHD